MVDDSKHLDMLKQFPIPRDVWKKAEAEQKKAEKDHVERVLKMLEEKTN